MTVRITKQPINLREKLSELERPIGVKGNELMRAETAQDARDLVSAGRKNLLINGSMQVWQRATSHTTASGFRSVDRWTFNTYAGGAFTASKGNDTTYGDYLSWNRTSADTVNTSAGNCIQQPIENGAFYVRGKYVTVSFWLKNDKTILRSGFVRLRLNASPYTPLGGAQRWTSTTTEWEYHSVTWQIPETIATTHLELQIQLDNGSSMGDIKITQVQLEVGKNATEFEHRSYAEELALCQRYYYQRKLFSAKPMFLYNSTAASTNIEFPVTMRATPGCSYTPGTLGTDYLFYYDGSYRSFTGLTITEPNEQYARLNVTGITGASGGGAGGFYMNNGYFLQFSAEL